MTARKGFKNQYSEAKVVNTVANIEEMVVKRMKARQFFKDYDKDGEVTGIVFVIPGDKGDLPFKMPARIDQVQKIIGNREQAQRTAWKNIYDWIDAQIALIETEQVKVEEVFLPYLTDKNGVTLFEIMQNKGFELPQLGSGTKEGEVING